MNNYYQNNNGFRPNNQFSSYMNPSASAGTIPPVASTNNLIWVQGIEGAKAWQLAPNSMVILLDSEAEGKMYIKVSDNIGMSSLRIFNYVEEVPVTNVVDNNNTGADIEIDLSQYVRKDELSNMIKEIIKNEQSVSTVDGGESSSDAATNPVPAKPKVIIQQQSKK